MMGVGSAGMAVALPLFDSWRLALVSSFLIVGAFFVGGIVMARDWMNLGLRHRIGAAAWTIGGAVPILVLLRWAAENWGRITGHAG